MYLYKHSSISIFLLYLPVRQIKALIDSCVFFTIVSVSHLLLDFALVLIQFQHHLLQLLHSVSAVSLSPWTQTLMSNLHDPLHACQVRGVQRCVLETSEKSVRKDKCTGLIASISTSRQPRQQHNTCQRGKKRNTYTLTPAHKTF